MALSRYLNVNKHKIGCSPETILDRDIKLRTHVAKIMGNMYQKECLKYLM